MRTRADLTVDFRHGDRRHQTVAADGVADGHLHAREAEIPAGEAGPVLSLRIPTGFVGDDDHLPRAAGEVDLCKRDSSGPAVITVTSSKAANGPGCGRHHADVVAAATRSTTTLREGRAVNSEPDPVPVVDEGSRHQPRAAAERRALPSST